LEEYRGLLEKNDFTARKAYYDVLAHHDRWGE
jgi:hypothetical protein